MQKFKAAYDRCFEKFHAKLMEQYAFMQEQYGHDFEQNFLVNQNDKIDNVSDAMETTRESGRYVVELGKDKEMDLSTLHRFFDMKMRNFYYRVCLKFWKKYVKKRKNKKRVAAYSRNTIYRNSMERFFRAWRSETHIMSKARIAQEEDVYRKALEREKLTMWSAKVD